MKSGVIGLIVLVLLAVIINVNDISASDVPNINWNFQGTWASYGFKDIYAWRHLVDVVVNALLRLKVVEINGVMTLVSVDPTSGNEKVLWDLAHFNNQTCELNFGMNITLPIGTTTALNYDIALNGDKNICHFKDYKKYLNQTLRDILLDLGIKNTSAAFIGKRGNITLTPDSNFDPNNPNFTVMINFPADETHPLIPSATNFTSINLTTMSLTELNITNIQNITDVIRIEEPKVNKTIEINKTTPKINFNIINPDPKGTNIKVFVSERKTFSIENTDYQTIKWFLDGKVVEEEENKYDFKEIKVGDYKLKVEISKDSITKSNSWNIQVIESKDSIPIGLIIFILIGFFVILAIVIISYYFLKKNQEE